jgi:hypothetical protein
MKKIRIKKIEEIYPEQIHTHTKKGGRKRIRRRRRKKRESGLVCAEILNLQRK